MEVESISLPAKVSIPEQAFGKEQWEAYIGDVGEEPPLPKDIVQILKSPCPIWKGKTVVQTHSLMLIPATVNGKPLTLKSLGEFVKSPKQGNATKYGFFSPAVLQEHGDTSKEKSYWVLIPNDVLPESRGKNLDVQIDLVDKLGNDTGVEYELSTALEVAVLNLLTYVKTGKRLYGQDPLTYARCQEKTNGYPVSVGGFASGGLNVYHNYFDNDNNGVAARRKF